MDSLFIEATEYTPKVNLDVTTHTIEFEGISRPENVIGFYQQVIEWLESYESEVVNRIENKYSVSQVTVRFKLQYFNSASAKSIMQVLQKIKAFEDKGIKIVVDFYFEEGDEQMRDDGEELAEAIEMEFNFHELS